MHIKLYIFAIEQRDLKCRVKRIIKKTQYTYDYDSDSEFFLFIYRYQSKVGYISAEKHSFKIKSCRSYFSYWENGLMMPSGSGLLKLAKILGVGVEEIYLEVYTQMFSRGIILKNNLIGEIQLF